MILIVTHTGDTHVPLVTRHLDRWSVDWRVLHTDEVGEGTCLRFAHDGRHASAEAVTSAGRIALADVSVVWNRRVFVNPGGTTPLTGDRRCAQFVREQRRAELDGALATIDGRWINPPDALVRARPKLDQLAVAARLGLRIPPTLVSDDPGAVREFAAEVGGPLVTKVVTPGTPIVEDRDHQYMVFTQAFDPADVSDAAIAAAPAIYQREIAKTYEARAIVVGDRVLLCRIDSQLVPATRLDWRHYDLDTVAHRWIPTPDDLGAQLVAMCRHYGLTYAAIDLARTMDGSWVFFELNPNGQWAWLEQLGGVPIGAALAQEMAQGR